MHGNPKSKKGMYVLLATVMVIAAAPIAAVSAAGEDILFGNNFGGLGGDYFYAAVAAQDGGFVAVGTSATASFAGAGDWPAGSGKGGNDAIIVKYDKDGAIEWQDNFGGSAADYFYAVAAAQDGGFVAAGYSANVSFGNGDWSAATGKGGNDAVIVKYDKDGAIEWQDNFGGSGNDMFRGVAATTDGGFVAVGHSANGSFSGSGDWPAGSGKGGEDAIIVKYDKDGVIEWQGNFGGSGNDFFYGVAATADGGVAAVGSSVAASFSGTGDWPAGSGKGGDDAFIVKYDEDGVIEWQGNFGGLGADLFRGVAVTTDGGIAAIGYSAGDSFGNGDWSGATGKGGYDATVVKYDKDGAAEWQGNFGSTGADYFYAVAAAPDGGIVATGSSASASFDGTGDWSGMAGKGGSDAIIVKYDEDGAIEWQDNFGGSGHDGFYGAAAPDGGFVAAGFSPSDSFDTGDWSGVAGKGDNDATAVWYGTLSLFVPVTDISGLPASMAAGATIVLNGVVAPPDATNKDITWSVKSAGATGASIIGGSLTAPSPGTVVVTGTVADGTAPGVPFEKDFAISVRAPSPPAPPAPPSNPFVPVTDITCVPPFAITGMPLTLTGMVMPSNATNQTIVWTLNSTGATLSGDTLLPDEAGTVVVTATIEDGAAPGVPFSKDFTITVGVPGGSETSDGQASSLCAWLVAAIATIVAIGLLIILLAERRKDEEDP